MAKGIPTRYEAITYTKPGTICNGSSVRGNYLGNNDGGGFPQFVQLNTADSDNPMLGTFYNPNASLSLSVLIGTVPSTDDNLPASASMFMSVAPGKREPFIIAPGWYLFAYYNDVTGGTFSIVQQGATVTLFNQI